MNILRYFCLVILFLLFGHVNMVWAQSESDTTQTSVSNQDDDVVEVGEAIIKVEVEKPQIQLFSQRIKPEFDEVNLEKSFLKEILDEGQELKISQSQESEIRRIDTQKLLNRNR